MAITVFDFNTNQWYVKYANGEYDPCHNRATAEVLARQANESSEIASGPSVVGCIALSEEVQEVV